MTPVLELVAFTLVPMGALILGIVYSLNEIYQIGQKRLAIIVVILGMMLIHQTGELATFISTSGFQEPVIGEIPETTANLVAAGSVYYVLKFSYREQQLKNEIAASKSDIEETNKRLELIFENVTDGILLVDIDDDAIVEANSSAAQMLRYSKEELRGLSPYDLHPHEPERFEALTNALRTDGGVQSDQLSCQRQDGSTMPAAVAASRATLDGSNMLLITIRDNTAREQYRTRVLRHNLLNDMSVLMGSLGVIEDALDDEKNRELADRALKKCEELVEMSDKTRKLNDVLETERSQIEGVTDIVPIVEDIVAEYENRYPEADIETDLPESALVQVSDNVKWAVENLVDNACVHADGNPRVRVTVENETTTEQGKESLWTTVTVADHGPGIPHNEVTVLEDDTKRGPTEHGSGLGLWVVQQIARVVDGKLDIERDPESAFSTVVSLRLQPVTEGYRHGTSETQLYEHSEQ